MVWPDFSLIKYKAGFLDDNFVLSSEKNLKKYSEVKKVSIDNLCKGILNIVTKIQLLYTLCFNEFAFKNLTLHTEIKMARFLQ